jgi:S-adenosylmethionine:tRNA-ribosyltransferase-isomerase (queuine synthetase)
VQSIWPTPNQSRTTARFKIAEACEKILKLSENTWAVYSVGTISTNKVCPAANDITAMQIQSRDKIWIKPGCYVRTMDHVISANESETIEVKIKTMDWAS